MEIRTLPEYIFLANKSEPLRYFPHIAMIAATAGAAGAAASTTTVAVQRQRPTTWEEELPGCQRVSRSQTDGEQGRGRKQSLTTTTTTTESQDVHECALGRRKVPRTPTDDDDDTRPSFPAPLGYLFEHVCKSICDYLRTVTLTAQNPTDSQTLGWITAGHWRDAPVGRLNWWQPPCLSNCVHRKLASSVGQEQRNVDLFARFL